MSPPALPTIDLPPLRTGGRILHAVVFEALAVLLCAPVIAWTSDAGTLRSGALMLAVSVVAMAWNVVFNALFDRALPRRAWPRGLAVRAVHAVLFEAGLMLVAVPLAAWWLGVGLWAAFWLDAGVLLFFLPYTVAFNAAADALRAARHRYRLTRCSARRGRATLRRTNNRPARGHRRQDP